MSFIKYIILCIDIKMIINNTITCILLNISKKMIKKDTIVERGCFKVLNRKVYMDLLKVTKGQKGKKGGF